ncbi:methyltransferase domain-containing protein [Vineibacter terrae]|uniref:Methyltransferase domain-containing protein n=1 Tax=Vineibacter terrae TaxID=2586908 RepID=A0A5C8PNQ9_9HYPH|nr:class I SAM-dependent methyltransferase [Vineibacter terrae]TXL76390.1 methyltransferase domain-containing protein [Vineibacter terrae]
MAGGPVRFEDGATYEEVMGVWSRLAGDEFLDWLSPPSGLKWIDIGCGNGAFTELLIERCGPVEVHGVDPSDGQLAYARTRPAARVATFQNGDAMALPFAEAAFDAAVMALVIVFVSDPAKGMAEMVRVVRPGGLIATYVWDMIDGGFPLDPILEEMRAMGIAHPRPPQAGKSRMEALEDLWRQAGLEAIETREISVQRTFPAFDDFWNINSKASTVGAAISAMAAQDALALKERVRRRLSAANGGGVTYGARANAIKGRKPK